MTEVRKLLWNKGPELVAFSWFIFLFPGRVHVDTEFQMQMMRDEMTTNQWTGIYFRLLQVLTLNGSVLPIASFASVVCTVFAIKNLTALFTDSQQLQVKIRLILHSIPYLGFLSVTVNHDIFSSAGLILLISERDNHKNKKIKLLRITVFSVLAATSYIGLAGVVVFYVVKLIKGKSSLALPAILSSVIIVSSSIFGITQLSFSTKVFPLLGDLKCVAQSDSGKISSEDMKILLSIQPIEIWESKESCASAIEAYESLKEMKLDSRDFFRLYLSVASENFVKIVHAHFLRGANAIPAPFGPVPTRTYDLNSDVWNVGDTKSNSVILVGPSEDFLPSTRIGKISNQLMGAIGTVFVFFGHLFTWAGFWITIILVLALRTKKLGVEQLLPLFATHIAVLLWSPVDDQRYLLATCLVGWVLTLSFLVEKYRKRV
jgi:hypothetical protein